MTVYYLEITFYTLTVLLQCLSYMKFEIRYTTKYNWKVLNKNIVEISSIWGVFWNINIILSFLVSNLEGNTYQMLLL